VGVISETDLLWQETGVEPPVYIMFLDSVIFLENPARHEQELHKALGQTVGRSDEYESRYGGIGSTLTEGGKADAGKVNPAIGGGNDQRKVIGILTPGDIVRAMAAEFND
jgi:hypothetical protein